MVHSSRALPPLDTLEAFSAAVRSGSFSAAAGHLGLTHGAISRQVSRLERWMGVRLFEREARGVLLTPEGMRFFVRAQEALALLGDSRDRWHPGRGAPTVRLSATPSVTALWLFPRLRELEGSEFHLDISLEHRLADFSEGVDLAMRCGRGPWAGVRSVRLWAEQMVPLASPAVAARFGADPGGAAILEWPLLHDSNIGGWRTWLAELNIAYAPRPQDRRFEDYNLVLEACASGLGIALARQPLAGALIRSGRLKAISDRAAENEVSFHLIRPEEPLRPQAAILAERLLRAAGLGDGAVGEFVG